MKIGGRGNKREWRWKAVRLKGKSGSHLSEEWTWSNHWVGWEVLGLSLLRWALSLLIEKLSELIGKTDQLFEICCIGHTELVMWPYIHWRVSGVFHFLVVCLTCSFHPQCFSVLFQLSCCIGLIVPDPELVTWSWFLHSCLSLVSGSWHQCPWPRIET